MSDTQLSLQAQVHQVDDRQSLLHALSDADVGDTIVINREGDYGDIRISNKSGIRIKSSSKRLAIQATLRIEGNANQIIIENLNIWNDNPGRGAVIQTGVQCKKIIIRHCMVSSYPVNMNNLQEKYAGEPENWINGINSLGSKCEVSHNLIANVRQGIISAGADALIEKNTVQYFSGDAIRVQQHGARVSGNHLYDAVLGHIGEARQQHAILLAPPEKRYAGGELNDVKITDTVVRSQNRHTSTPRHRQGSLQGIIATDGYFVDWVISHNSLVLNTDQGILLNGVKNLQLANNKVIAAPGYQSERLGIKLYLTRISTQPSHPKWLANQTYSVRYANNQAPLFNIPDEAYEQVDLGHNHFATVTHELAYGHQPNIIYPASSPRRGFSSPPLQPESSEAATMESPVKTPDSIPTVSNRVTVRPVSETPARSGNQVYRVTNATELKQAINQANPGDTILITRAGNYGHVYILNKSRLRIKSFNTDIPIQLSLVIDGSSHTILIENMQLWNDDLSRRYIIITGKSTSNIYIRNCILSTVKVNRNTMRRRYSGDPQRWISGIRMLGSNGQIISNYMMNLKMAVLESGPNTLIQFNLVQFYSEDAIRVSHHGVKVLHNNIYDSVATHPGQNAHKDAIQLIPPINRYTGGELLNVKIVGNIIQSFTHPPVVPEHQRGIVQGIFGSDGYFVNALITGNTVMVNSDHGITLNGVRNLQLRDNHIVDQTANDNFNPGIKLYLTRISQFGQQKWLANRAYSVKLFGNQAPILNVPNEAYTVNDLGANKFASRSHDLARGNNPIIIRNRDNERASATPSTGRSNTGVSTFTITNRSELERATRVAAPGDTILFKTSGYYGQVRLTHKSGIRIRSASANITVNAHFLLDGNSSNIIIEGLNLWFSERNWKPVILAGPDTTNISIRNCLISSYQVTRSRARNQMTGAPKNWITGIWLRGTGNEVINNHIVNVRAGIVINGTNVLVQNNLIQYFSDAGIRVINDNIEITHNNIYDAIALEQGSRRLLTGIQLIPAEGRFQGGKIRNIKVTNNVIQVKSSGSPTPDEKQGLLQGITLHDGYISGMVLNSNTVVVNTEHGITINGASGLSLNGNRVFDSRPNDPYIPGIKLYYTRTIDVEGNRQQVWRTGRDYSVSYSNNQAAEFNIPNVGYDANDGGGNNFRTVSHYQARGMNPVLAP